MSHESPPASSRPAAGGEFTWPPTREELDAIDVIPLDDTSSVKPVAVVPAKVMAAPAVGRRGRLRLPLRLPRRDDLVFAGVIGTSVLAIAVAASMQFSDLWLSASAPPPRSAPSEQSAPSEPSEARTRPGADQPLAPLIAQELPAISLPAMSPIAMSPIAMSPTATAPRAVERRRVPTSHTSRSAIHARRSATYARRAAIARPSPAMRVSRHEEDHTRPRLISPERGRSGKLVLLVEVRKNGKVGDVDVLSSNLDRENRSHRDLQRAAISTVKRWRYTPAIRDGEPTGTQVRVVVDINLDSGAIGAASEADVRRRAAAANRVADSVRAAR